MEFVRVARADELPRGAIRRVVVGRTPIALFNLEDRIFAIHDTCTHARASLAEGMVAGDLVACPLHGARFNIKTGAVVSLPAVKPVRTFPVRQEGDDVLVGVEESDLRPPDEDE